jgi:hypothetical protein
LFDGINRASGANSERIRRQSRFSPALPEMVSYDAEMIASIDSTSAEFAGVSGLFDCFIAA